MQLSESLGEASVSVREVSRDYFQNTDTTINSKKREKGGKKGVKEKRCGLI